MAHARLGCFSVALRMDARRWGSIRGPKPNAGPSSLSIAWMMEIIHPMDDHYVDRKILVMRAYQSVAST